MSAMDQMRFGATVMAAIFGGPGVFYCVESFVMPSLALTGILYLAAALLLICAAHWGEATPARRKLPPRKRR